MKDYFKITSGLVHQLRDDLRRPHPFAAERVGFITCRAAMSPSGLMILAHQYYPVADEDYVENKRYGALIGPAAFRKALQVAYSLDVGLFHIHLHAHRGRPSPSRIDLHETKRFVPDFFHVRPKLPHGALIVSNDSISGRFWHPDRQLPRPINEFVVVGAPLVRVKDAK